MSQSKSNSHPVLKPLIPQDRLQQRVSELALQISLDYGEKGVALVAMLRGSFVFAADLIRSITGSTSIDFMAISSYGKGARESTGNVRLTMDLQTNIHDKHVLLVEDIIDSGLTIASVLELLETRQPKSLKVCSLLDKEERREAVVPIHYRGFSIPNKFVFGYGLDLDEYYRNLPFIGVVDLEKYRPPS